MDELHEKKLLKTTYEVGEVVKYFSKLYQEWKIGKIDRFTEEGFTICASIWEKDRYSKYDYCNHIPLNNEHIRKIVDISK